MILPKTPVWACGRFVQWRLLCNRRRGRVRRRWGRRQRYRSAAKVVRKPEGCAVARSRIQQLERTLGMATRFLDEVRGDIGRAALEGADIPPRLRSVHEKPGHATPEFRTVAIPIPDGLGGVPPEILSGTIARYAQTKKPDCLLLAMEAEMDADGNGSRQVLIAEARDRTGTRMYWMQPYSPEGTHVDWAEPLAGG